MNQLSEPRTKEQSEEWGGEGHYAPSHCRVQKPSRTAGGLTCLNFGKTPWVFHSSRRGFCAASPEVSCVSERATATSSRLKTSAVPPPNKRFSPATINNEQAVKNGANQPRAARARRPSPATPPRGEDTTFDPPGRLPYKSAGTLHARQRTRPFHTYKIPLGTRRPSGQRSPTSHCSSLRSLVLIPLAPSEHFRFSNRVRRHSRPKL